MRRHRTVAVLGVLTVLAVAGVRCDGDAPTQARPAPVAVTTPTAQARTEVPTAQPSRPASPSASPPAVPSASPPASPRAGPPVSPAASSPEPAPTPVVQAASGTTTVVPGGTAVSGSGPLLRYTVAVEEGLGVDPAQFAAAVDGVLGDARSWQAGGRMSVQRVDRGPVQFRVVLASPETTDRLCRPLRTAGIYSCGAAETAVINGMRWLTGADAYAGQLPAYRQYVINHEVGHTVGKGHVGCPGAGRPAPVMMQQTKGIGACAQNPWPFP